MICPNCENKIPYDSKECPFCGEVAFDSLADIEGLNLFG